MHKLFASLLFVFASSAISPNLAKDYEGLASLRDQLYFDPYDYELRDEDTRNADETAILIQPEEVIDIPPNPLERDDGESDSFNFYRPPKKAGREAPYRAYNSGPAKSRNIIQGILSKLNVTVLPSQQEGESCPEIFYNVDPHFHGMELMFIHRALNLISQNLCVVFTPMLPHLIPDLSFRLSDSWHNQVDSGVVHLCRLCFGFSEVITLTLMAMNRCPRSPWLPLPPGGITGYVGRSVRENDDHWDDCYDKHHSCPIFARNQLCDEYEELLTICPYSCQVCGDSCVDHANCDNIGLDECVSDWEKMKLHCAKTCGACVVSDDCHDKLPNSRCRELHTNGMCEYQKEFMSEFCLQSCTDCVFNDCEDTYEICWPLAVTNRCHKYPHFTEKFCQRSCGFCRKGDRSVRGNYWCNMMGGDVCRPDDSFLSNYCRGPLHQY